MPANGIVQAAAALARGLRTTFLDTYEERVDSQDPRLATVMDLGNPSDKVSELYAYWETAPYPERWDRGESMPADTFDSVNYEVENLDWAKKIPFHENDLEDDQTGGLLNRAQTLATHYASLPTRVAFQILTAATDDKLLEAIPNAPDGASLYANQAGGVDRFGVSNGNLLSGSGVSAGSDIRTDLFSMISQWKLMQDTEGQPLFDDEVIDQGILIIYGAGNEEVFTEAFSQRVVHSVQSSTGAGVTNIFLDTGRQLTLWSTQRITDNDWFGFLEGSNIRPLLEQLRRPVRDNLDDFNNSYKARDTKIWEYRTDSRVGFGINLPYSTIKINN